MKIEFSISLAKISDVNELIALYRLVYGKKYPISYGTDAELLKKSIKNTETHQVLVARMNDEDNMIVGGLITEIDARHKIGKLVGLVVHPSYQKKKIGLKLVNHASEHFLEKEQNLNSLYATTRTIVLGPQKVFIKNKYFPLGIFPNAHRLHQYETVTLFAKFRAGLIEKRNPQKEVSLILKPIYDILKSLIPSIEIPQFSQEKIFDQGSVNDFNDWNFEIIKAPTYVYRKFEETFPDKRDHFFPFHTPNLLISDKLGRMDIFAHYSKRDGYCTIIKSTAPISEYPQSLTSLYMQLDDLGVSYLEVLVNVKHTLFLETLYQAQFVPSAIYPGMREVLGELEDYIVMSRTMEPLNFRGMAVLSHFKPFVDQYVDNWKRVNLDTIEVVYEDK